MQSIRSGSRESPSSETTSEKVQDVNRLDDLPDRLRGALCADEFPPKWPAGPISGFLRDVAENRVASIQVSGREIVVWRSDTGGKYVTTGAISPSLLKLLADHDVAVTYGRESGGTQTILLVAVPVLLLLGLLVFFLKKAQGGKRISSRSRRVGRGSWARKAR